MTPGESHYICGFGDTVRVTHVLSHAREVWCFSVLTDCPFFMSGQDRENDQIADGVL